MIAGLRRRHRWMVVGIGVVTFVVMIASLSARSEPVVVESGPPPPTSSWTAFGPAGLVKVLRERERGREWLLVERGRGLAEPDALLYWAPAAGGPELPADAVLVGPLSDPGIRTYDLPEGEDSSVLLLYSLGHRRVLDSLPISQIRSIEHKR